MNPKQFLQIGGAILILVGIFGFVGIIGPTAEQSIFGSSWWFDNGENWAHLILGLVGLLASFAFGERAQKSLVVVLGVIGVLVGFYGLVISTNFLGANLENPADTILHLLIGAWALWAAMRKPAMAIGDMPPQQDGIM